MRGRDWSDYIAFLCHRQLAHNLTTLETSSTRDLIDNGVQACEQCNSSIFSRDSPAEMFNSS